MRLLVANRGEIARRVFRTAARLGIETVAAWADPDRDAPFVRDADTRVRLGPAALDQSYLSIEALIAAAAASGATAIHPGYGFLSENARFARAVLDAGLTWVGPHPEAIERMGSKIEARAIAVAAGVPTIPGYDESQRPEDLAAAAQRIGFPVLVKAAAGGGGKGIRIVREPAEFEKALKEAIGEAKRSFGDDAMIVERYVEQARHVEVQVVGDRHANVIHLGTRECSVQRRYQKLLEEAPAPNLSDATRQGLCAAACALARAMQYDSAGTVEFVVDAESEEFFFLEMNTRLQVEHPVSEEITGLDLVELQLRCARGEALPLSQEEVRFRGHAFEARINAEDAQRRFVPQVGTVERLRVPPGVRFESGVEAGSEITPWYDSMVAKLIVYGPDREAARRKLAAALDALLIGGLVTNTGFQRWLIEQPLVASGRVTTRFLDENPFAPSDDSAEAAALAAAAFRAARRAQCAAPGQGPWSALDSFRVTPHRPRITLSLEDRRGTVHDLALEAPARLEQGHLVFETDGLSRRVPVELDLEARRVWLNLAGQCHAFRVLSRSERWAPSAAEGHESDEAVRAPFPGVVTDTPVAAGQRVKAGDTVVVIEAMKMLHSLTSRGAAVVSEVHVAVGDSVDSHQALVSFEAPKADDSLA